MAQSISDKISAEYDSIRSQEALQRNQRISEIHKKFPELEQIRSQIASSGYRHAMELSKDPLKENEIRQKLHDEVDGLEKRRKEILEENNIPEDYDKIRFRCELCQDTGYVENEKCRCYKAKLAKYAYEQSNLSKHMQGISFDKFNLKYFSDEADKDGISALQRIEKALAEAKNMASDFDNYKKSFLYFGSPGSGKTFLAGCIANSLIEQGYSVLYVTAGKLFEMMENKKYGRPRELSEDDLISTAYTCDLLILDDLGNEFPSKLKSAFAYDILNERLLAGKKLIINTNLTLDQLSDEYSQRFVSRLFEHFYALRFTCTDIRKQKMYERL